MALIVEDGSGSATAESYLSVADADTYWAAHGAPSEWTDAVTAAKETALRVATQYLDAAYGPRWQGQSKSSAQRLAWPRAAVLDLDGYLIASDDLPRNLEEATAEAALRQITETDGLMPDVASPGGVKSQRVRVGPLEKAVTYLSAKDDFKMFSIIDALLRPFLESQTRIERG